MSWLTRTNWATGQPVAASDLNNMGLDIRTQGSDADAGSYGKANLGWVGFISADPLGTQYPVTNATWSSGTATITIGTHHIRVGQTVVAASISPSGYNTTASVVTGVASTTISYAVVSNPGAYVSGGTITVSTANGSGPSAGMLAVNPSSVLQLYNGSSWLTILTGASSVYAIANINANWSATQYLGKANGTLNSTEANVATPMQLSGTFSNLTVTLAATPGVGITTVYTVRKNGSSTTMTCTITGASQLTASDNTHTFTVVPGDLIDVQAVTTGGNYNDTSVITMNFVA